MRYARRRRLHMPLARWPGNALLARTPASLPHSIRGADVIASPRLDYFDWPHMRARARPLKTDVAWDCGGPPPLIRCAMHESAHEIILKRPASALKFHTDRLSHSRRSFRWHFCPDGTFHKCFSPNFAECNVGIKEAFLWRIWRAFADGTSHMPGIFILKCRLTLIIATGRRLDFDEVELISCNTISRMKYGEDDVFTMSAD